MPRHAAGGIAGGPASLGDALGAGPQPGDDLIPELAHRRRVAGGGLLQTYTELSGVYGLRAQHVRDYRVSIATAPARPFPQRRRRLFDHAIEDGPRRRHERREPPRLLLREALGLGFGDGPRRAGAQRPPRRFLILARARPARPVGGRCKDPPLADLEIDLGHVLTSVSVFAARSSRKPRILSRWARCMSRRRRPTSCATAAFGSSNTLSASSKWWPVAAAILSASSFSLKRPIGHSA